MNQTLLAILASSMALISFSASMACDSGSDGTPANDPLSQSDSIRLSSQQREESMAFASDFEKPFLQDGVITFQEYEQATFAAIECFKSSGFSIGPGDGPEVPDGISGPRLTKRGKYTYNPVSPPNYSIEQFGAAVAECKTKHSGVIDFFWAVKSAPSETELQDARKAIGVCLRESGREVPEQPTSVELVRIAYPPDGKPQPGQTPPEFYQACATPVADDFDLPGFLG